MGISRKFTKDKTWMTCEDNKKYVFHLTVSGECKVKQDLTTVSPGRSLCPGGKEGIESQGTEMPRAHAMFWIGWAEIHQGLVRMQRNRDLQTLSVEEQTRSVWRGMQQNLAALDMCIFKDSAFPLPGTDPKKIPTRSQEISKSKVYLLQHYLKQKKRQSHFVVVGVRRRREMNNLYKRL